MAIRNLISVFIVIGLSGCGGGSGNSEDAVIPDNDLPPVLATPEPTVYTGVFLDSAVNNLSYSTASGSGKTNEQGEFTYQLNETITFSIGNITFPEVDAANVVTPLTLFDTQDVNELKVVNSLRLIQSLDIDGDASNGIDIPNAAHEIASDLTVDFSSDNFDIQVAELVEQSGALNQQLISAEDAVYHFQQTLSNQEIGNCEKTHEKIGQSGFFNTLAHNVAGKATIIDDCTIQITQFDYDGGGPDVYFYAAKNHEYASDEAFAISQMINGQSYENAEFILTLPTNKSLDDLTGLSVWCVDFDANFGQMEFSF